MFAALAMTNAWDAVIYGAVWGAAVLAVANVWLIMTGRMGYLVMLLALGLALWRAVPARWRWSMVALALLASIVLFELSPRVHERWLEVQSDVQAYQRGDIESSQGLRLEMWRVSLQAAEQAHSQGAQLLVTPELALCGYPPEDLLLRPSFAAASGGRLRPRRPRAAASRR